MLEPRHRRDRLRWARRHVRFTRADWARVVFTDEKRFSIHGSDGRDRVYRRRNERYEQQCIMETRLQGGGGSEMVWAGVSMHHKTDIVFINGNMNAARYQAEVLQPHVIPLFQQNRGLTLVQDGATPHTARTTTQLLNAHGIQRLDWPSRSPDLNIIENVWSELQRRVRRNGPRPQTVADLRVRITREWMNIRQNFFNNYVMSMRARCLAVIRANGGHTRY